jgi:hypothetical protein
MAIVTHTPQQAQQRQQQVARLSQARSSFEDDMAIVIYIYIYIYINFYIYINIYIYIYIYIYSIYIYTTKFRVNGI